VNLFYQPLITENIFHLDPEESRHCTKVLRKKSGDSIDITDGKGLFYHAIIEDTTTHQCTFRIESRRSEPPRNFYLHIVISPTKNPDRTEWFVEKAVEIGVDEITFIECARTERIRLRTERISKLAVSAMKQSLKATLPKINDTLRLTDFLKQQSDTDKFIAFVDEENPLHLKHAATPGNATSILIGPEGDFSHEELSTALSAGYKKVSLGKSRLRTETAGLVACHTLHLINL
jgi:16S rRNA (uracil1498-N3)-methyltransferase